MFFDFYIIVDGNFLGKVDNNIVDNFWYIVFRDDGNGSCYNI